MADTKTPTFGPLHPRHGPYIRSPQPLANGLFLVEQQKGVQGKGKVWRPAIVRINPDFDPSATRHWLKQQRWLICAEANPRIGKWAPTGSYQTNIYWDDDQQRSHVVKGYFPDEATAVAFMIRFTPEMVK